MDTNIKIYNTHQAQFYANTLSKALSATNHPFTKTILLPSVCCSYWRSKSKSLCFSPLSYDLKDFSTKCYMNNAKSCVWMFFKQLCTRLGLVFFKDLLTHLSWKQRQTKDKHTTDEISLEQASFYDLMHILKRSLEENPFDYSKKKLGNRLVCRLQNAKKGVMHEQRWCVASCLVRAVLVRQHLHHHHHTRSITR